MSIKQSIALLLLFFGVSFSASATDYYRITRVDSKLCGGWGVGAVITNDLFSAACIGGPDPSGNKIIRAAMCSVSGSVSKCSACWPKYSEDNSRNQCQTVYTIEGADAICPDGEEYNPETGLCEGPPEEPFCSQESTQQEIESARLECESLGGLFSYSCSNETESWEPNCI